MFKRGYQVTETFPWKEIGALFAAQVACAIAVTSLFPYVGYMVVHLHMSSSIETAGYYAGFIAAAMMLGRIMTSCFWGKISDSWGRKPVICICTIAAGTCSLLFGLSPNFATAVASRFFLGFFNPILGTSRTLASEICSKKYEAFCMGTLGSAWFTGLTIGPAVGGLLARPCELYPDTFKHMLIFQRFPYLLPNLICSVLGWLSFIILLIFLPETLPEDKFKSGDYISVSDEVSPLPNACVDISEHEESKIESESYDGLTDTDSTSVSIISQNEEEEFDSTVGANIIMKEDNNKSITIADILRGRGVIGVMVSYFLTASISMTFDEVFPLWSMSSSHVGGLDYSIQQVGVIISISGILLILFTFIQSPITNALGPSWSFITGLWIVGPILLAITLFNGTQLPGLTVFTLLVTLIGVMKMGIGLSLCGISLVINHLVDSTNRGSLNGLVVTIDSIAKMLGLAYGPVTYAYTIDSGLGFPFDFHFVFIVLALLTFLSNGVFVATRPNKTISNSSDNTVHETPTENMENNNIINYTNSKEEIFINSKKSFESLEISSSTSTSFNANSFIGNMRNVISPKKSSSKSYRIVDSQEDL